MKTHIPVLITLPELLMTGLEPGPYYYHQIYIYISIIFLIFSGKAFLTFFIATQGGAPLLSVSLDLMGEISDITG